MGAKANWRENGENNKSRGQLRDKGGNRGKRKNGGIKKG